MSYNEKLIELQREREQYIQKIEDAQREIERHESQGILDVGTYNGVKNKLQKYNAQLEEVYQQIEELELVGVETQNSLETEFEDFGGTGLTLRGIIAQLADENLDQNPEDVYQLISIYIKEKMVSMANENAAIVHSYKSELASVEHTVGELSKIKAEYEAIHIENIELGEKVADLTAKRDAAAAELDAIKAENARLKEDAVKLREQLENRNKLSDGPASIQEFAAKLKANRKTIYDVVPDREMNPRKYTAKLADTHEPIEISHYALAGYNVLEGESLARFQEEMEAKKQAELAEEPVQLAPSIPIPQPFQDAEVPAYPVSGEVVPETKEVTRAEFEALKQQVDALESRVRGVA